MKKFLLTIAAAAMAAGLNAQQTYNFFDAADVDSDGWLWFDTQAKLDKYCGYASKTKSFAIQLQDADYELEDFSQPQCTTDAGYTGLGTDGTKGGANSRTGAIILPPAGPGFSALTAPGGRGGAIMLHLPDCAKLDVCVSAEQEAINLCVHVASGNVRVTEVQMIKGGEKIGGVFGDDLENVTYTGNWNDIEQLEDSEYGPNWDQYFKIQSNPGEKRTVLIGNYMKNSPLYIHGICVLTYSDNSGAGVEEIGNATTDDNAPLYNVFGMKVDSSYKGIVIKNGKKFVNR